MRGTVRFWRNVAPLVRRVLREAGLGLNRLVNEAVLVYLGQPCAEEELRLRARRVMLLREEESLRQRMRVVLRSGAFLDSYADKLLLGKGDYRKKGEEEEKGRKPLKALSPEDEAIVLRMLARREALVAELREIEDQLLTKEKYRLKRKRRRRRSRRPKDLSQPPPPRKPHGRRRKVEYQLPDGSKAVVRRFEPSRSRRRDKNKTQAGENRAPSKPNDSASLKREE